MNTPIRPPQGSRRGAHQADPGRSRAALHRNGPRLPSSTPFPTPRSPGTHGESRRRPGGRCRPRNEHKRIRDLQLQELRGVEPVQRRAFEHSYHLQQPIAYDIEESERTRELAPREKVRAEDEPVHETVADEPDLLRCITLGRWADNPPQTWGQLSRTVKDERILEGGKPICILHRLANYRLDVGGAVEVELAPDEVLEDRRSVPILVHEVQPDGRDPADPLLLIQVRQLVVFEEQDELYVGEFVALVLGEGAVHHRRNETSVLPANAARTLDHGLLLEHRPPCRPTIIPGCYLSTAVGQAFRNSGAFRSRRSP